MHERALVFVVVVIMKRMRCVTSWLLPHGSTTILSAIATLGLLLIQRVLIGSKPFCFSNHISSDLPPAATSMGLEIPGVCSCRCRCQSQERRSFAPPRFPFSTQGLKGRLMLECTTHDEMSQPACSKARQERRCMR